MKLILNLVGVIVIILGFAVMFIVMNFFSKPGMFSQGKLEGFEVAISIGVLFYHIVFGVICIGVSQVLESKQAIETAGSDSTA